MTPTILKFADYAVQPWANRQGETRQIAIDPSEAAFPRDPFFWRASTAPVPTDGSWSQFPGYDRGLVILEGNGVRLSHPPARGAEVIRDLYTSHWFSGDLATKCKLVGGPVVDFTLLVRRSHARGRIQVIRCDKIAQAGVVRRPLSAPFNLFYCARGRFEAGLEGKDDPIGLIGAKDTFRVDVDPGEEEPVLVVGQMAEGTVILGVQIFWQQSPRHEGG